MAAALTDEELLAFCALTRLLVRLDHRITEQEREAIERVGPQLATADPMSKDPYRGAPDSCDDAIETLWTMMERAAAELTDDDSIRQAACGVTRQVAREDIYAALYDIAASDAISDAEWTIMEWLSSEWGISV